MSNKRFRQVVRVGHIIEGAMIAAFVYSPTLRASSVYTAIIQFVIVPLIILSGVLLWQQPRVMKWIRRST